MIPVRFVAVGEPALDDHTVFLPQVPHLGEMVQVPEGQRMVVTRVVWQLQSPGLERLDDPPEWWRVLVVLRPHRRVCVPSERDR